MVMCWDVVIDIGVATFQVRYKVGADSQTLHGRLALEPRAVGVE